MSQLTVISKVLAFEDLGVTSNPSQRPINWEKTLANAVVYDPCTRTFTVEPGETLAIIDGTRSTDIDGTTEFDIAVSELDANRYRITHSAGTAPAFRVDRLLTLSGVTLTLTMNANLSMTMVANAPSFSNVQIGDVVFIPGVSTGDVAGEFNALNEGHWSVLSRTSTVMALARPSSVGVFSGASEVVIPSGNGFVQAFAAAGVQAGDTVDISAGFASTTQHSYEILAVNPNWVEISSTAPLGPEDGVIPGASGFILYTAAVRYLRIQADQECVVRLNGDTGNTNRLEPIVAGDQSQTAWMEKWGPSWKVDVVNRTLSSMRLVVLQAE